MADRLLNPATGQVKTLRDGDDENAYRLQGWVDAGPAPVAGQPVEEPAQVTEQPPATDLGPDTVAEAPTETHEEG